MPETEISTELELLIRKLQAVILARLAPVQTIPLVILARKDPIRHREAPPLIEIAVAKTPKKLFKLMAKAVDPVTVMPVLAGVVPTAGPTITIFFAKARVLLMAIAVPLPRAWISSRTIKGTPAALFRDRPTLKFWITMDSKRPVPAAFEVTLTALLVEVPAATLKVIPKKPKTVTVTLKRPWVGVEG